MNNARALEGMSYAIQVLDFNKYIEAFFYLENMKTNPDELKELVKKCELIEKGRYLRKNHIPFGVEELGLLGSIGIYDFLAEKTIIDDDFDERGELKAKKGLERFIGRIERKEEIPKEEVFEVGRFFQKITQRCIEKTSEINIGII